MPASAYQPRLHSESLHLTVRGLPCHVRRWGHPDHPPLLMVHGWMDVSASFQFLVDCLKKSWCVYAPDWRGYGQSMSADKTRWPDAYWFPDYLADLDAFMIQLFGANGPAVNVVAHSLGGSVATLYSGIRPHRVRALVNLEGYGMRGHPASQAPKQYANWLDEILAGAQLRDYASFEEVAQRLQKNNPRMPADKALYLAQHWSKANAQGRYELLADPAHKLGNPGIYREDETRACWSQITAPVLLVDSDHPSQWASFAHEPAYQERLASIRQCRRVTLKDCGHMMHHDQPEALAALIEDFLPN
jgi:pimeloyl-ACP methyl ester carboxylesterase